MQNTISYITLKSVEYSVRGKVQTNKETIFLYYTVSDISSLEQKAKHLKLRVRNLRQESKDREDSGLRGEILIRKEVSRGCRKKESHKMVLSTDDVL